LSIFPNEILNLKNLTEIDLTNNAIADIPLEILQLSKLRTLRISKNLFTDELKKGEFFQEINKLVSKKNGIFEY
jgi:Leucine-rich repeat (LRR) protein